MDGVILVPRVVAMAFAVAAVARSLWHPEANRRLEVLLLAVLAAVLAK